MHYLQQNHKRKVYWQRLQVFFIKIILKITFLFLEIAQYNCKFFFKKLKERQPLKSIFKIFYIKKIFEKLLLK